MKTTPRNVTAAAKWMPCPKINTEYPGLAYICPLNELYVVKQTDVLHDLIDSNATGYTIFNNQGQKVFLAVEKNGCTHFHVKIYNRYGNEVIKVERHYKPFLDRFIVWAPPGHVVGVVKQASCCTNTFHVQNWYGLAFLQIKAERLLSFDYEIRSMKQKVGEVKNNWVDKAVLNVKNFGVSFPIDMDVSEKAALIGACFLIGCMKYR